MDDSTELSANRRPRGALVSILLSTQIALLLVPDLTRATLLHPTFAAVLTAVLLLVWLLALRPAPRDELRALAAFLFLMPTVYLAAFALDWFLNGRGELVWLMIEAAGQIVFAVFALLGVRRGPGWLAAGILLHGIGWDLWHYGLTAYMPDWYALACLAVDVGWSIYVWLCFVRK